MGAPVGTQETSDEEAMVKTETDKQTDREGVTERRKPSRRWPLSGINCHSGLQHPPG